MSKYGIPVIGALFLVYGAVRLGVSTLLLMQLGGAIAFPDLQDGLDEIDTFMTAFEASSLLPMSSGVYLGYLWIMGALLVAGALGIFKRHRVGSIAIATFLGLYVLLFINFQTINPKVFHLIVCALLLGLYLRLNKKPA